MPRAKSAPKEAGHQGLSDSELVHRVCQGHSKYYEELMNRYQRKMFAYVFRLTNGHREDSLDIVQNVFIKAYQNLTTFNRRRQFSSWLYRIAHNEAINFRKGEARRATISLDQHEFLKDNLYAESNQHDAIIQKEGRQLVDKTLAALPAKYREVLTLRFIEDRTYEEMSEILQKPVSTIGTLLNRGRAKFEKLFKRQLIKNHDSQ